MLAFNLSNFDIDSADKDDNEWTILGYVSILICKYVFILGLDPKICLKYKTQNNPEEFVKVLILR